MGRPPKPKKTTLWTLLIVVAFIASILAVLPVYRLQEGAWGWVFWNDNTALVFIGKNARGFRFSQLGDAFGQLEAFFPFAAFTPAAQHQSATVLILSGNSIKSYSFDNFWVGGVQPFNGTFYVPNQLGQGRTMKWVDTHFEPANGIELAVLLKHLASLPNGPPSGPSYDNVEGWSKRTIAGVFKTRTENGTTVTHEDDSQVTVNVNGQQLTFSMNSGFISHHFYIDLLAAMRERKRFGMEMAAMMRMIATTMSNSISEKPLT
jgi:hypothetical protein